MLVDSESDQCQGGSRDHLHQPGMLRQKAQQQYHQGQIAEVIEQGGSTKPQPLMNVGRVGGFHKRPPLIALVTYYCSQ